MTTENSDRLMCRSVEFWPATDQLPRGRVHKGLHKTIALQHLVRFPAVRTKLLPRFRVTASDPLSIQGPPAPGRVECQRREELPRERDPKRSPSRQIDGTPG